MATNDTTVTALTGAAVQNTSKVYKDCLQVNVNLLAQSLEIVYDSAYPKRIYFGLETIATVSYTIASHIATISFT